MAKAKKRSKKRATGAPKNDYGQLQGTIEFGTGGWRKGITAKEKKEAEAIAKKYGFRYGK